MSYWYEGIADPYIKAFLAEEDYSSLLVYWDTMKDTEKFTLHDLVAVIMAGLMEHESRPVVEAWYRFGGPLFDDNHFLFPIFGCMVKEADRQGEEILWKELTDRIKANPVGTMGDVLTCTMQGYHFMVESWLCAVRDRFISAQEWMNLWKDWDLEEPTLRAVLQSALYAFYTDFISRMRSEKEFRDVETKSYTEAMYAFLDFCRPLHEEFCGEIHPTLVTNLYFTRALVRGNLDEAVKYAREVFTNSLADTDLTDALAFYDLLYMLPPLEGEAPALPAPLSGAVTDDEVMRTVLASWDGKYYRNLVEILRDVDWSSIDPLVRSAAGTAVIAAALQEHPTTPETERLAGLLLKRIDLPLRRRSKEEPAWTGDLNRILRFLFDTITPPKDTQTVERLEKSIDKAFGKLYADGFKPRLPFYVEEDAWFSFFELLNHCEPFDPKLAVKAFDCCPDTQWTNPNFDYLRFDLLYRLYSHPGATAADKEQACVYGCELALTNESLEDQALHDLGEWFARHMPITEGDDYEWVRDTRSHHWDVGPELVKEFCDKNGFVIRETIEKDVFRKVYVLQRPEYADRWWLLASIDDEYRKEESYSVRYLLTIGERGQTWADLRCASAAVTFLQQFMRSETRDDCEACCMEEGDVYYETFLGQQKPGKLIPGYDYAGLVTIKPRGCVECHFSRKKGKALAQTDIYELVLLLPDELKYFERDIEWADFTALFPGISFEAFAPRSAPTSLVQPKAKTPVKRLAGRSLAVPKRAVKRYS